VEVWWPASETRQHFAGLEKNQAFEITEQNRIARRLARTRVPLPTPKTAATHAP
jgi:hypothetical protein